MTARYSHSQLALFKSCHLRYFYRLVLGLTPLAEGVESHHLAYGRAGHAALAHLYRNSSGADCSGWRAIVIEQAKEIFRQEYPVQLNTADRAKTIENGVKAIDFYASHYLVEDLPHRVLEAEERNLSDDDWQLHLDLVTQHQDTGAIYGWDHKITGGKDSKYLGDSWWRRFEIDSQITQYISQIEEKYGRCDGFYINALGMRAVQREKATSFKGSEYTSLGSDGYIFKLRLGRQMYHRTPEQIEDEWGSVDRTIEEIEESARLRRLGVPSMRAYGFNCQSCMYCEYRPVCANGYSWERDQMLIELQYRRVCNRVLEECTNPECSSGVAEGKGDEDALVECSACDGTGQHPRAGYRCTLDRDHEGRCDDPPPQASKEIEGLEVEV